ncbi:MAG: bifunctional nuclease family protein [Archaeoglobaceae archaeon]|nr:bifunctional nuclease family protein [Archaeoglobaceae archaeon]MDW7989234.1 bifunctional nuclease family protein [Archaeoglobaceae archaeon]
MLSAEVYGVFIAKTEFSASPVVVLRAEDGRILPIYIGFAEAASIYSAINRLTPPRPMTHDLLIDILSKLEVQVERVVIDDLIDNTFYARIIVKRDEREIEIDARPSDSIAIALRISCPIFIDSKILDEAGREDVPSYFRDFAEFA